MLRVAWFTSLPSHHPETVSAYVSDLLVPRLRQRFELSLFSNVEGQLHGLPVHHYLLAAHHDRARSFDVFFYQLEDSPALNFSRIHLAIEPGIVLFHDLLYSSFGPEPILNSPWQMVQRKLTDGEQPWLAHDAEHPQEGPMAVREAMLAGVPVFSFERGHGEYRRLLAPRRQERDTPSWFLPLPAPIVDRAAPKEGPLRIALCATPRIEHRAHKLLLALSELPKGSVELRWLLNRSERPAAEALLQEFSFEHCTFIEGRTPARWGEVIREVHCACHLLFSVFGQLGPYLPISLRVGLPTLTSRFGSTEYLPERVSFQIEPGESEANQIRQVLEHLRLAAGLELPLARTYAAEHHDVDAIASQLAHIIEQSALPLRQERARWQALQRDAVKQLRREAEQLLAIDDAIMEQIGGKLLNQSWEEFGWGRVL